MASVGRISISPRATSPRGAISLFPGHEIVGIVDQIGPSSTRFSVGDRVGIPWLARTCGICRFCASGRENLCVAPTFTGWDRDGGYAPYAVADEAFVYALPLGI